MKIYLAGNFPQMATEKKERRVLEWALQRGSYARLVSYYYRRDGTDVVLNVFRTKKGEQV